MDRFDSPRRRVREREYDEFHESLATPARPYRDDIATGSDAVPTDPAYARAYSPVEQVVRVIASILTVLLALRFVVALFSSNIANPLVNVLYTLTDWIAQPFQALFGTPPSGGGGYIDLPALAAIVLIALVSWVISLITRDYR